MSLSVFKDKVVVITGAGSGIGRALALQLASEGANLALADINEAGLEETKNLSPQSSRCTTYQFNVADRVAYQDFVKQVIADHQHVDIVINNAGVVRLHSIEQGNYEDYEITFDINVWGVLYGCKEFIPYLKQRPQAWLANISSGSGIIGIENYSSYNASKFAVRSLTESLTNELLDTNITVSCIMPGGVSTNIQSSAVCSKDAANSSAKLKKVMDQMTADEAAQIILTGMAKGKKRILVGPDVKFADLIARLLPGSYYRATNWLERKCGS